MERNDKYIRLLSEKYPTMRSLLREIINLSAILNLPKGTEHFMSDIHGEYEAFCHILNNCAGVIREKNKATWIILTVGAVLFALSDSLIAVQTFHGAKVILEFLVMVTYVAAQSLLAWGGVRLFKAQ